MARQLQALGRSEGAENFAAQLLRLQLEGANLVGNIDVIFAGEFANLLNARLELAEGFFKVEEGRVASGVAAINNGEGTRTANKFGVGSGGAIAAETAKASLEGEQRLETVFARRHPNLLHLGPP